MSARVSAVVAGILAVSTLGLSAPGSFTIDQVMSAPFASSVLTSPTGNRVAWLLNEKGERNIWVAAAPDWVGHKLTTFTRDDGQDIDELAWGADSSYLLFARGGDFENGGENPNPDWNASKPDQSIWKLALDGSPARKLTEGRGPTISSKLDLVAFIRGGQIFTMRTSGEEVKNAVTQKGVAEGLRWSPDGTALAFETNRQNHSFIGIYRPADRTVVYLDPSVDHDSDPVWSPDGTKIAFLRTPARGYVFEARREGEPWSIRVADAKTGMGHEVFRAKPGPGSVFHRIEAGQQVFWASGDRLVFPWELTGWCHLYSIPATDENYSELTPGEGEVEHVSISNDGKTMFYSSNIGDIDRRHLWEVSVASGSTPKQVTRGEDIQWSPMSTTDGSALLFLASSYNEKAHAAVRTADGHIKALAPESTPSDYPAAALVRPQPVMITAADGMVIHGQLFLPKESNGQRHPALIFFHGGSRRQMLLGFHYMYYYSNAYAMNQYLASQGYVVLSANYRSGIGYGLNFREAINYGARGGSEFNDVIGAGLFLKARADVDPKRIGVWGGSYGGYLTAMALSRASDLFAAGVDFHGVHDWSARGGVITRSAPVSGDPEAVQAQQEAARIAFESSPMASVKTWKSPVLLIHGDDDRNVDFSQTVILAEALRNRHVYFEQLIIPNEIHDFLMYRSWVTAYKAAADFFARKLQNGVETSPGT